jgi:hypothetical protein
MPPSLPDELLLPTATVVTPSFPPSQAMAAPSSYQPQPWRPLLVTASSHGSSLLLPSRMQ